MVKKKTKVIIYSFLIVPLFIIISELSLAALTILAGVELPNKKDKYYENLNLKFDLNTGSYVYENKNKSKKSLDSFINNHGLIKTNFRSDKKSIKTSIGIAITGNSVAMGYPLVSTGNHKNTFVNKLETKLRAQNDQIDIINLSNYGFNSWQENVQIAKYLNSEKSHDDLPNLKMVASLGGIQDFWAFVNLLNRTDSNGKIKELSEFHQANGLMSIKNVEQEFFLQKFDKSSRGNILAGLNIFIKSLITNITSNSFSYGYYQKFFENKKLSNDKKYLNKDSQDSISKSISELITKKLNITQKEYLLKKNIVIDSTLRNIKSMMALNEKDSILFVYLPTKFGHTPVQYDIEKRFKIKELNIADLHLLEKDYRNSLIKNLSGIQNLNVFDLSFKGRHNWFYDESHYSEKGHEEISNLLLPIFLKVIN